MAEVKDITLEDIQNIAAELRKLKLGWAEELATNMRVDAAKVYNIVNGVVRHQQHRRFFVSMANLLITKYREEQQTAVEATDNILNTDNQENGHNGLAQG